MLNPLSPVLIKKELRHRFYASVVFLSAVTGAYATNRQRASHDLTTWSGHGSFDATFRDFVDKLSQFCDVKLGGDSVTAFTVLDLQDRIQYRFACNRLNKSRLTRIASFVTDLLETLRAISSTAVAPGSDLVLLQKVLVHCRTRVHSYLGYFKDACRACVETRPDDATCLDQLRQFVDAASDADFKSMEGDEFTRRCRRLMGLVETAHGQPGTIFAERPAHSSMNGSASCWSDLRHYAGRLVSYLNGVRTLLRIAEAFPGLLQDFEVVPLRSSEPDDNPLAGVETTAERMLRSIVRGAQAAARYGDLVQEARSLDLDAAVQAVIWGDAGDGALRPIVHAELLVLQSLEREGLTHPSSFYNAWRYIGSSKPTCRLCSCYFQAHDGGFQVRPTHGNLYASWKPPDVLRRDGGAAARARAGLLNRMVGPIRAEALRTLTEKVPLGKRHDSSTGMTFQTRAAAGGRDDAGSVDGEADVETSFGGGADGGVASGWSMPSGRAGAEALPVAATRV